MRYKIIYEENKDRFVCQPLLSDIERELKDIDEKDRKMLLKSLQGNLDI